MSGARTISDSLIDAWDDVRRACERVEMSLPTQLSANVEALNAQWRRFDTAIKNEAKRK